jgi:putative transposase
MRPDRRSLRLPGYDYSLPDAYFVTLCTHNRECLFGDIQNGKMRLNNSGEFVLACWNEIPTHFPRTVLDAFVVMPNHVHGIIWITNSGADGVPSAGMTHASSLRERVGYSESRTIKISTAHGPARGSIGAIV